MAVNAFPHIHVYREASLGTYRFIYRHTCSVLQFGLQYTEEQNSESISFSFS